MQPLSKIIHRMRHSTSCAISWRDIPGWCAATRAIEHRSQDAGQRISDAFGRFLNPQMQCA